MHVELLIIGKQSPLQSVLRLTMENGSVITQSKQSAYSHRLILSTAFAGSIPRYYYLCKGIRFPEEVWPWKRFQTPHPFLILFISAACFPLQAHFWMNEVETYAEQLYQTSNCSYNSKITGWIRLPEMPVLFLQITS